MRTYVSKKCNQSICIIYQVVSAHCDASVTNEKDANDLILKKIEFGKHIQMWAYSKGIYPNLNTKVQ